MSYISKYIYPNIDKVIYNSKKLISGDVIFKIISGLFAISILIFSILLLVEIYIGSKLSIDKFGLGFLTSMTWDPVHEIFGAFPFIFGTIVSSFLALFIAVPISIGIAIFISEIAPKKLKIVLSYIIELIASFPSVIIGLWGIFVLVPFIRDYLAPFFSKYLGFIPLFQGNMYGASMLAGGLILAIMIIPIISSISRDIIMSVPSIQKEAAFALGATRWEAIKMAILPYSASGIFGATILGFGRAIGETMAVTMVIGNSPLVSGSLFSPAYTMTSVIANEFVEATSELYVSSIIEIGLLLLLISLIINIVGKVLIHKLTKIN